ncbi:MAG TPA: inositol monophosphatase family protein [Streptosporangiaceae bacterium]|nr:inositol monophosphatase family protein [Streptosporangiaceae bacterium]
MAQSDVQVAVAAAQAGAAVVRARFGAPLVRFQKAPLDFATDADIAAENAILDVLRADRPADAYQGEELGRSGNSSSDRSWLIDPLCGTLNFAAGTPIVAVNVALRSGNRIEVAASADPFAGEVFWTDGQHARARRDGTDLTLRPSAVTNLVEVNIDPPFPNLDRFQAVRMLADSAFTAAFRPRVLSTTLPLAWVAAGRRAAYVTDGHLSDSVHFASGIALCQAAGCVVTGLEGQPLHTGVGGLVAAADGATHAALIEMIAAQFTT